MFRSLAELVYASKDFAHIYHEICAAAPRVVSGCDHASLMLKQDGAFVTVAASDEVARRVDALEREVGEGPCLDAILHEDAYLDPDLTVTPSWPRLADRLLAETPVRGVAGCRFLVGDQKVGALNVFSDTPGGLTEGSVDVAIMLASFVSVTLVAAHEKQDAMTLRQGLESNREIGKAVGLLMAFHKITDEDAFEVLRTASQEMNIKLAEVARQVVEHHNHRS
jgi:hypothetical protein